MAVFHDSRNGKDFVVEADLLIGRSPNCGLRLHQSYVSGHHATVRWIGPNWQLKDLGSHNGTLLNGSKIESGRTYDLRPADKLAFGHAQEEWVLADAGPPGIMVIPLGGGEPLPVEEEVLGIPNAADPQATLFHDLDGCWKLETEDGEFVIVDDGSTFEVAGRAFRFSIPDNISSTASVGPGHGASPPELRFAVSRDEEHVELRAFDGVRTIELGARSHNYLLLTLARARLRDAESGTTEASAGWVYQDDLLNALQVTATQLNIDVFRIRQHFARAGLHDSISVVERRPRTKQLRIGTGGIKIRVL